jgi:hypothetical protein
MHHDFYGNYLGRLRHFATRFSQVNGLLIFLAAFRKKGFFEQFEVGDAMPADSHLGPHVFLGGLNDRMNGLRFAGFFTPPFKWRGSDRQACWIRWPLAPQVLEIEKESPLMGYLEI